MAKNILRLILPVSIMLFAIFTKWWLVSVDPMKEIMYGFPFIYKCRGFHTSLSMQYFMSEMIVDFLFYFLTCFSLFFIIGKWIMLNISRLISSILWFIALAGFIYSEGEIMFPDNMFTIKRDFKVETIETGISTPLNIERGSDKYNPMHIK